MLLLLLASISCNLIFRVTFCGRESKSFLAHGLQNDLHRSFEATRLGSIGHQRMT